MLFATIPQESPLPYKNKFGLFKQHLIGLIARQFSQAKNSPQRILLFSTLLIMPIVMLSLILSWSSNDGGSATTQPLAHQDVSEVQYLRGERPSSLADESNALSQSFIEEYDRLSTTGVTSTSDRQTESRTESISPIGVISFGLLIVVAMVYVIRWVGSNLSSKYGQNRSSDPTDSIIVRVSKELGPGQKLQLIQFGDEILLLGVTAQTISLLTKYSFHELPEDLSALLQSADRVSNQSLNTASTSFKAAEKSSHFSLVQSLEQLRQLNHESTGQT